MPYTHFHTVHTTYTPIPTHTPIYRYPRDCVCGAQDPPRELGRRGERQGEVRDTGEAGPVAHW